MTRTDILPLLLRRWRVMLISGLLVAVIAFGMSRIMPQLYSSEGSLIVENAPTVNQGEMAAPSAISNVLTQVDVLQSKGLADAVVKKLDLTHAPTLKPRTRLPFDLSEGISRAQTWIKEARHYINGPSAHTDFDKAVTYLRQHLTVASKDESSVITVGFQAGTPKMAALVANTVMQTYLTIIGKAREAQIDKTNAWIQEQLRISRQDVTQAETRLNLFVASHNLAQVQQSSTAALQLSENQADLVKAREVLAEKQAALRMVLFGGIDSAPGVLDNHAIENARQLEVQTLAQLSRLGPHDPRRGPLLSGLHAVQGQISRLIVNVLVAMRAEVAIAQAHVSALEAAVAADSGVAQSSAVADATYKQLSNDLEAKRQLYVAFLTQAGHARAAAEQTPTVHVLFNALPPEEPARSFGVISLAIGLVSGIFGAAGVLIMRNSISLRIHSTVEMAEITGLPVFGSLPKTRHGNLEAPKTQALVTETFRAMWVSMQRVNERGNGTTIMVTSSEVDEGKTTVAEALARRFADDGLRVLLFDADLRRPQLAKRFNLTPINLESVINGETSLETAVQRVSSTLHCLPSDAVRNPVSLFSSEQFGEFLRACQKAYDYVILDTPPVLHVADPKQLARLCNHIIFVTRSGHLPVELVREAVNRFPPEDRAKMFTLLTRVGSSKLDSRDYFSGYNRWARGRL